MLSDKNMFVLVNIIGAVESGGQVYGNRRYDAYTGPYTNSSKEVTVTLGWAQNYGSEARKLIQMIYDKNPSEFKKLDTAGIESMLSKDWVSIKWKPSSSQKSVLINLISSDTGKYCQDMLFSQLMKTFVSSCEKSYTDNVAAVMMYCEIRHLGGSSPAKRIFDRCGSDYSLTSIMNSLKKDQSDTSSNNQVGDNKYWSRHIKCKEFIEKYADMNNGIKEEVTGMTEKDILICGHGSGNPSKKNMYTYLSSRYSQLASNGRRKGVVEVLRLKGLTDAQRKKFHDTYKTIIGRNIYNQNLRDYCYRSYNGRYYSDCSSSICLTFKQIGISISSLNTAGMHYSNLFEKVAVKISNGHITNPSVLKVGDCIMFVGNDPSRPLQIGHVEAVYEMPNGSSSKNPSGSGSSSSSISSAKKAVMNYQIWMNANYPSDCKAATGSLLVVDGDFGPNSRKASLRVWKYMANKYYGTRLTLTNTNFLDSCKAVAAKMTLAELKKHSTFAFILQGLLAGRGYYGGNIDGDLGPISISAINQAKGVFKLNQDGNVDANLWYKLFN